MTATINAPGGPATGHSFLDRYFGLSRSGTSLRTEFLGGLTTFVVMAYIIAVNPAVLNLDGGGLDKRQVATVTCLVAGVMTILMGVVANRAIALAPGLGLNAVVAYSLVGSLGLTFPEAMGVIVAEGIVILLLVLLGIRRVVLEAVPLELKKAISVGIGFFILFIGLNDAQVISYAPGFPELRPLNTWPIFVSMVGLGVTILLIARRVKAAVLIGILISTAVAFVVPGDVTAWPAKPLSGPDFGLIGNFSFHFISRLGVLTALLVVLSLMLSDFFDTMGTLVGVGQQAGYLDENGQFPNAQPALVIDSLAAIAGGAASSSSATVYIESAAGVSVGARTGLASIVTGVLFLLSLPLVNLVNAIPQVATAPGLIIVGFLMVGVLSEHETVTPDGKVVQVQGVDFNDVEQGLPVTLCMLTMPFTFSITNGIGVGFITYTLIKLARGKGRIVHPAIYVVSAAFLLYFLRWALFNATF